MKTITEMYNCNFCDENIDRYYIENHFVTFHKFRGSDHKQKSNNVEAKLKSFEDGKSKFLQLMNNFESEKDALSLYYWIKSDTLEVLKLFVQDDLKIGDETGLEKEEFEVQIADQKKISMEKKHSDGNNLNSFQESLYDLSLHQQEIFEEDFSDEFQVKHEDDLEQDLFQSQEVMEDDNIGENDDKGTNFQEEEISNNFLGFNEENILSLKQNQVQNFPTISHNNIISISEKTDLIASTKDPNNEEDRDELVLNSLLDYNPASRQENFQVKNLDAGIKKKSENEVENGHMCSSCSKVFSKKQDMLKHIHTIHEKRKCYSCRESFSTLRNLKKHIQKIHEAKTNNSSVLKRKSNNKIPIKQCATCGKSFFNARSLKRHIHRKCEYCDKSFTDVYCLKKHFHEVHEGQANCKSCGKLFSVAASLRRHITTVHEKRKEFKCDTCGESFSQKPHLKSHIHLIHILQRKRRPKKKAMKIS